MSNIGHYCSKDVKWGSISSFTMALVEPEGFFQGSKGWLSTVHLNVEFKKTILDCVYWELDIFVYLSEHKCLLVLQLKGLLSTKELYITMMEEMSYISASMS